MKIPKYSRRLLASALCGCLLLAGCGQAAPADTEAPAASAATEPPPTQAESTAPAKAPYPVTTLLEAVYPEMAPYPVIDPEDPDGDGYREASDKWFQAVTAQQRERGYADSLQSFWGKVMPTFLGGSNGENKVVSPVNLYMTCAMLAQVTGGESRNQVLSALGE